MGLRRLRGGSREYDHRRHPFRHVLAVALIATYRPFGDYMARVFESEKHLGAGALDLPARRGSIPRPSRPGACTCAACWPSRWSPCSASTRFLRVQQAHLFGHPYAVPQMHADQAFNTAASFVTNTNWQSYSGESALGYAAQAAGLTVQNFASAAVGIAVAIALVRGFTRSRTDRLGNFWVDLTRICIRILLPDLFRLRPRLHRRRRHRDLAHYQTVTGPSGDVADDHRRARSPARKPSRSSAPTAAARSTPTPRTRSRTRRCGRTGCRSTCSSSIGFSLPRAFGRMVKDKRQGLAIVAVMAIIFTRQHGHHLRRPRRPITARFPRR